MVFAICFYVYVLKNYCASSSSFFPRDISRLRDRGAELPDDYTESSQYAYRKETNGSVVPDEDYSQASRGTSSLTPKPKYVK